MRIPTSIIRPLLEADSVLLGGTLRRAVRNYVRGDPREREDGEVGPGDLSPVTRGIWRERMISPDAYLESCKSPRFIGAATGRSGTTWLKNVLQEGLDNNFVSIREVGLFDLAQFRGAPYEYFQYANLPQRDVYRSYFRDFVLRRAYYIRRNMDGTLLGVCDLVPRRVVKSALDRLDMRLDKARGLEEIEQCFGHFYIWLFNAHAELTAEGRPWISKEPPYGRNADQLFRMIPHARLVVLVRDGRDVALSMYERGWHPTVRHAMDRWRHFAEMTDRAMDKCPEGRCLVLRYRDLVRDFEESLASVTEALDLPSFNQSELDRTGLTPDPSSIDRWKTELSAEDCDYFTATCTDVMKRFGLPV